MCVRERQTDRDRKTSKGNLGEMLFTTGASQVVLGVKNPSANAGNVREVVRGRIIKI